MDLTGLVLLLLLLVPTAIYQVNWNGRKEGGLVPINLVVVLLSWFKQNTRRDD